MANREWALSPKAKQLVDLIQSKGQIQDREVALRLAEAIVKEDELYGALQDDDNGRGE